MLFGRSLLVGLFVLGAAPVWAGDVLVEGAWVRGTVAAQRATGAFMRLTASEAAALVGASSPAASVTEVHEMAMHNDVMRMRPTEAIELPAGQAVELKPGGYHIMLMGLKAPLAEGDVVPITLRLRGADGAIAEQHVDAPVMALTAGGRDHGAMHPR